MTAPEDFPKGMRRQKGFGLIEVMIAMVIGLIAMVVVLQTIAITEGQRRSVTGGADAMNGSAVASYLIGRDLRMAGYGLASVSASGILARCGFGNVVLYNADRSANAVPTFDGRNPATNAAYVPFTPVAINPSGIPAGDAGSDTVMINYSGSFGNVADRAVIASGGDGAKLKVSSRVEFHQGDLVMVVSPPTVTPPACEIAEISGLPGSGECGTASGATNEIERNAASFRSYWTPNAAGCETVASKFNGNSSTTLGLGSYDGGRVFSLGPPDKMASRVYAVRNRVLTMCNMLTHDCTSAAAVANPAFWKPIAPGIVAMSVELGKITGFAANNSPNWTWDKTAPTSLAGWINATSRPDGQTASLGVAAVRFVLVARSDQYEKEAVQFTAATVPDASGNVSWARDASGTAQRTISLTGLDKWDHYRYKVIEGKVPLRNLTGGRNLIECPLDSATGGCA